MSSILKALKKLEQEKASRKPDSFKIDTEILRDAAPRRRRYTGASLTAIALFLCGVGATYVFMKRQEVPVTVQSVQTPATDVSTVPPIPPTSIGLPSGSADKDSTEPLPRLTPRLKPGPESSGPARHTMQTSLQPQQEKPAGGALRIVQPESKPLPPVAPPAAGMTNPPVLRVHGIAFQDGSANAVAVVNGVAVSKGSVIEGVRVEEILKDRVTFSRGGETFEVILEKSN